MRIGLIFKSVLSLLFFLCSLQGCASSGSATDRGVFFDDFAKDDGLWITEERIAGGIAFGCSEQGAGDGRALLVSLPGDPSKNASDDVGPSSGNQAKTREELSYGTYRFRMKAAPCTPSLIRPEEVITGAFVYSYGGDENENGFVDNDEIDFEFACSAPHLMNLTVWTDYDEESDGSRKAARIIDMRTGRYSSTGEPTEESHEGTMEGIANPDFDATSEFHEMGFVWSSSEVLFFYSTGGVDATIWRMDDASLVPRPPAPFYFNAWHAEYVWFVSGELFDAAGSWIVPAFYPAEDASALVDWFEYEES